MDNPFSSQVFKDNFLSHFVEEKNSYAFGFIRGVEFYRHPRLPLYINIGRNLTKGIEYEVQQAPDSDEFVGHTCLVYDVPDYVHCHLELLPPGMDSIKVRQYPGYSIDLGKIKDIDVYFRENFSKPTRYKLRKYRRRLENSFNVRYMMYEGPMEKSLYEDIFRIFLDLLKKRYSEKQIRNNNLDPKEWTFYEDIAYQMILDGKATLFVIYDQDTPIAISLNYINKRTLISAITVFDTDYGKFHLGSIAIWKQLEWCMENNKNIFDFSKGYFSYKSDWATNKYNFEHHILYKKKSITSFAIASYLFAYLSLKQFFRSKNWNDIYNRIRFKTKNYKTRPRIYEQYHFEILREIPKETKLMKVSRNDADHSYIKKPLNEFLYLHQEHVQDVDVLWNDSDNHYYLKGKSTIEFIAF